MTRRTTIPPRRWRLTRGADPRAPRAGGSGARAETAGRVLFAVGLAAALSLGAACAKGPATGAPALGPTNDAGAPLAPLAPLPDERAALTLVESFPEDTTLDHPSVPEAADVWLRMIDGARASIDLAELYASDAEEPAHARTSKLTPVVEALARAAARGVRVRLLLDASFASKYPKTPARLAEAGVVVRTLDVAKTSGGVLHSKMFVVDDASVFLGSQNFDWRALGHIYELGVRVEASPSIAGAAREVFETDWAIAGGADTSTRARSARRPAQTVATTDGDRVTFVASPTGWLPDEATWDLPRLVAWIDAAKQSVRVTVLKYGTVDRTGAPFTTLDDALRRALHRGVRVELLVSSWAVEPKGRGREALEALAHAGAHVKVMQVPPSRLGEIPFARVTHAKLMVVDGARAWIGTSNWEGDYFTRSRNVGLLVEGLSLPPAADAVFRSNWASAYASPLTTGSSPVSSRP